MSKKILVILAHDDMKISRVNKRFIKELESCENVEIRDLKALYPDYKINIEAEQEAIRNANKVVFQFPMFWFNAPSILKEWMDKVYSLGFAFDVTKDGYQRRELDGREFMLAVSMGGHEAAYDGEYKSVDECLTPYIYTAKFCGMRVVEPFYTYRAMQNLSDEKLEELAPQYKDAILK
ncbi:NAD(P)H-dependent oxidoreductase [Arcobacter sp. LA11]|uniref:NAD(P)H-dependent oxidoreductase n=1 Tax=Arcobacter sp. LA11 TaxID=1898176 RepID=UPI0009327AA4|nr:NAD(P)H-dependent oxidoreductase [Arcobacter sp. LA11]